MATPRSLFEVHITVADDHNRGAEVFKEDCRKLGVKAILIELESGRPVHGIFQYQTGFWAAGSFDEILRLIDEHSSALQQQGWRVVRQKCEVTPSLLPGHINCPIENEDLEKFPPQNYFEFHVKLEIPTDKRDEQMAVIRQLVEKHRAHLSRNAFKSFSDCEHRFVTQRVYRKGQREAYAIIDAFVADALATSLNVVQVQREYAVYDTNVDYDAGWVEPLRAKL